MLHFFPDDTRNGSFWAPQVNNLDWNDISYDIRLPHSNYAESGECLFAKCFD